MSDLHVLLLFSEFLQSFFFCWPQQHVSPAGELFGNFQGFWLVPARLVASDELLPHPFPEFALYIVFCIPPLSLAALRLLQLLVVGLQTVPCGIYIILFSLSDCYLVVLSFHGEMLLFPFQLLGICHTPLSFPSIHSSIFSKLCRLLKLSSSHCCGSIRLHVSLGTHWPLTCLLTCCWGVWSVSTNQQHRLWYLSSKTST